MKKNRILTVLSLITLLFTTTAQEVPVTHFMYLNPYRLYTDPSASTPYNGYVGIPAIGNLNFGLYNSSIRYNNLFTTDKAGYPTTLTVNKFINSLDPNKNFLNLSLNEEILGFGFRAAKKFFFTFDYRLRADMDLSYSKDLFGFPLLGNQNYLGEDVAHLQLGLNGSVYQEFGIGIQHQVNDMISWGARAKLLFGAININTTNLYADIATDEDDYSMLIKYNADAQLASIVPISLDLNNGSYNFAIGEINSGVFQNAFRNPGFAFDLGFRITPIKWLSVSASVLDLGLISWKTSAQRITSALADNGHYYHDGGFLFTGLSETDLQNMMSEEGMGAFLDSVAGYFPLNSSPIAKYTRMTNPRFMLQAEFHANKDNRFTLLGQGVLVNHSFRPALTVAYNGHFFNVFDICLAYTLQKNSYDNLAVGLGFDIGPINLYVTTHNILTAFDRTRLSKLTGTVGLVVNWGHMRRSREEK